jgi:hypothetical protein
MAVNATAIWRVRPSGSNTNGGGYDPGISGAATDYSQQNSAQATGTHGATTGTTTFTDSTANAFTSVMVGNAIYITGTGQTTGWYFVVGFTSASAVTLDRSPGTGTGATWNLGGGWADFWTNTTSSGPLAPGNIVYILGSGTPNPASYVYDYTANSSFNPTNGNASAGMITFANDPSTPGYKAAPDTTGGMPCISFPGYLFGNVGFFRAQGLFGVGSAASSGGFVQNSTGNPAIAYGCVVDQFGYDTPLNQQNYGVTCIGCEVFSSVSKRNTNNQYGIFIYAEFLAFGCNVHDCIGGGIFASTSPTVMYCIAAKNGANGINAVAAATQPLRIIGNTVDGNAGNGIEITTQAALSGATIINNIISNHTSGGAYGLAVDTGTLAANDLVKGLVDYNVYYNNTADLNNVSYGPHDTHGGSNPYVGQSTENYTLA